MVLYTFKYLLKKIPFLFSLSILLSCSDLGNLSLDAISDLAGDKEAENALEGRGEDSNPVIVEEDADDEEDTVEIEETEVVEGCGDGKRDIETEECDDGNTKNGDGCSSICESEANYISSYKEYFDVGYAHVCYIDNETLQMKCWGNNDYGQLGQENTEDLGDSNNDSVENSDPVNFGEGLAPELVSLGGRAGSSHTCILTNVNQVKCFGDGGRGQLGNGSSQNKGDDTDEMGDDLVFIDFGDDHYVEALETGAEHNCVILNDESIKCWGMNDMGQLGLGNTKTMGDNDDDMGDDLDPLDFEDDAVELALGNSHSCALFDDGTVRCWGNNFNGQLGQEHTNNIGDDPDEIDTLPAIDLGTGRTATTIVAGGAHSCALLDNGTVKCWGYNLSGQLGQGGVNNIGDNADEMGDDLDPIDLGTGRTALALAAGDHFTCAILDNHRVKCWGQNASGQLGQEDTLNLGDGAGEMGDDLPTIDLGSGRLAEYIAAGGSTVCAMLDNDDLKCWGENSSGQLGQSSTEDLGDEANEMGDALVRIDLEF